MCGDGWSDGWSMTSSRAENACRGHIVPCVPSSSMYASNAPGVQAESRPLFGTAPVCPSSAYFSCEDCHNGEDKGEVDRERREVGQRPACGHEWAAAAVGGRTGVAASGIRPWPEHCISWPSPFGPAAQ